MKNFILTLICLSITNQTFAINLKEFHDKNFDAIGNYCGVHLEASKNHLFVTYIIPPSEDETIACSENGHSRGCNGTTQKLVCDDNGICSNAKDDR